MGKKTAKLLGITIDIDLKFDEHLSNVCLKTNRKLSTLTKIREYLDFKKKSIIFKGFLETQFKYCLFSWMFYSKSHKRRINDLYKRAHRLMYNDYKLTFKELLEKDGSFTIHYYNT